MAAELEYLLRVPTQKHGIVELGFTKKGKKILINHPDGKWDSILRQVTGEPDNYAASLDAETIVDDVDVEISVETGFCLKSRQLSELAESLYDYAQETGHSSITLKSNLDILSFPLRCVGVFALATPPGMVLIAWLYRYTPKVEARENAQAIYKAIIPIQSPANRERRLEEF